MKSRAWPMQALWRSLLALLCVLGSLAYATRQTVPPRAKHSAITVACSMQHGAHAGHLGHCAFCFSGAFALEAGGEVRLPTPQTRTLEPAGVRMHPRSSPPCAFDARAPPSILFV